jgi:hypothetical protein
MSNKQAVTVLGPVDADALGVTLAHEHLLFDQAPYVTLYIEGFAEAAVEMRHLGMLRRNAGLIPDNARVDDPELAARSSQLYSPYWISKEVIVPHGGSSFGAPSFSPATGLVYVTGKNGAIALVVNPVGDTLEPGPDSRGHTDSFSSLDRISEGFPPEVTVSAYDPATGEQAWQAILPAQTAIGASGNLPTAGNLVFQGVEDGGFYALDATTGEILLRYDAPRPIRASPMAYQIDGKQYVTVVATNTVVTLGLP